MDAAQIASELQSNFDRPVVFCGRVRGSENEPRAFSGLVFPQDGKTGVLRAAEYDVPGAEKTTEADARWYCLPDPAWEYFSVAFPHQGRRRSVSLDTPPIETEKTMTYFEPSRAEVATPPEERIRPERVRGLSPEDGTTMPVPDMGRSVGSGLTPVEVGGAKDFNSYDVSTYRPFMDSGRMDALELKLWRAFSMQADSTYAQKKAFDRLMHWTRGVAVHGWSDHAIAEGNVCVDEVRAAGGSAESRKAVVSRDAPVKRTSTRAGRAKQRVCFYCGLKGHTAYTCGKRLADGAPIPNVPQRRGEDQASLLQALKAFLYVAQQMEKIGELST